MGFGEGHTFSCWTTSKQKQGPADWDLARCSLLGNSFHAGIIAWLLAHALFTAGIIPRLPTTDEIADPQLFMNLFDPLPTEYDQLNLAGFSL